jgi:hypothetical protein
LKINKILKFLFSRCGGHNCLFGKFAPVGRVNIAACHTNGHAFLVRRLEFVKQDSVELDNEMSGEESLLRTKAENKFEGGASSDDSAA